MFEGLKKKTVITEKKKNYFKFNFEKATNVGKLCLLPKIVKGLSNAPEHPLFRTVVLPQKKFRDS